MNKRREVTDAAGAGTVVAACAAAAWLWCAGAQPLVAPVNRLLLSQHENCRNIRGLPLAGPMSTIIQRVTFAATTCGFLWFNVERAGK